MPESRDARFVTRTYRFGTQTFYEVWDNQLQENVTDWLPLSFAAICQFALQSVADGFTLVAVPNRFNVIAGGSKFYDGPTEGVRP